MCIYKLRAFRFALRILLVSVTGTFMFVPVSSRRHAVTLFTTDPAILQTPVLHSCLGASHRTFWTTETYPHHPFFPSINTIPQIFIKWKSYLLDPPPIVVWKKAEEQSTSIINSGRKPANDVDDTFFIFDLMFKRERIWDFRRKNFWREKNAEALMGGMVKGIYSVIKKAD